MNRRRVMLVWGVLLIVLFMLSALPVAWASPTQGHGRFTVPTRTPTGSPATQAPTDEPPPTQEQPTDQPPPPQAPTNTPVPRTATATPSGSTGTHTRTLPTTPTTTPLPTVAPTLTVSPTSETASPTATVSATPEDTPTPTLTTTPAGDEAQSGQMGAAVTNTEAGATGVSSETTETLTTSGSASTETLSSSPAITSSEASAGVVTVTPFGSEGETERRRISPLFLGGVVAIVLGVVIWFLGKRLRGPSSVVPEPNHAVPHAVERVGLEEGSEALPSPRSDVSQADNAPSSASYSGEEDGA
jgi:hypothetical protein